ncbi:hypothetical protein G163CM_13210 [Pseudocitrobacter corydidari]|uniref:Uncharacterized protein n=1 Tax=Pseudocitrobacter corydidari TaxID=2891570 RepID=A0ABY3S3F5_9ENTR|nr:hypothetical protein G163CM_13210 [Pseudocitrobacter corydidari]
MDVVRFPPENGEDNLNGYAQAFSGWNICHG